MLIWTTAYPGLQRSQVIDHGIRDTKGRAVGGFVEIETRQDAAGSYYYVRSYATRDGSKHGAIPRGSRAGSLEYAQTLAERKIAEQGKRYAAQYGYCGGES